MSSFMQAALRSSPIAGGDSHCRSLAKAFSWRVIATLTTATIAFIVTGEVNTAALIGGIEFFVKFAIYYIHERVWTLCPERTTDLGDETTGEAGSTDYSTYQDGLPQTSRIYWKFLREPLFVTRQERAASLQLRIFPIPLSAVKDAASMHVLEPVWDLYGSQHDFFISGTKDVTSEWSRLWSQWSIVIHALVWQCRIWPSALWQCFGAWVILIVRGIKLLHDLVAAGWLWSAFFQRMPRMSHTQWCHIKSIFFGVFMLQSPCHTLYDKIASLKQLLLSFGFAG